MSGIPDPQIELAPEQAHVGIGARMRAARLQRGLTLVQLAGDELTPSFLSMVERGRSRISLEALQVVARRLDLPPSYFLDETENLNRSRMLLDRAEADLLLGRPQECLRMLERSSVPTALLPRARWLRGRALIALNRPREAVSALEEGIELVREQSDATALADLHISLAVALVALRSYDDALSYARAALRQIDAEPRDPARTLAALGTIGDILTRQGDSLQALATFERAVEVAESLRNLYALGAAYMEASATYERKGDVESAGTYAELGLASLRMARTAEDRVQQIAALAEAQLDTGNLDEAVETARVAVAHAGIAGAREIERRARTVLASAALASDDLSLAEREAEAALALGRETDFGAVKAMLALTEVAERRGDAARTDALYRQALENLKGARDWYRYARTAIAYSRLLRRRGDTEQALEYALLAGEARTMPPDLR